jgi:hypothetical protein
MGLINLTELFNQVTRRLPLPKGFGSLFVFKLHYSLKTAGTGLWLSPL